MRATWVGFFQDWPSFTFSSFLFSIMAKMKGGDYTPEDESQSQWALRAERNKRKGQMSQNSFDHDVGIYSFCPPTLQHSWRTYERTGVHKPQDGNVLEVVWRFQGKMWLWGGERIRDEQWEKPINLICCWLQMMESCRKGVSTAECQVPMAEVWVSGQWVSGNAFRAYLNWNYFYLQAYGRWVLGTEIKMKPQHSIHFAFTLANLSLPSMQLGQEGRRGREISHKP